MAHFAKLGSNSKVIQVLTCGNNATDNRGGGGGGVGASPSAPGSPGNFPGGNGGSGVVIIRYRFQ